MNVQSGGWIKLHRKLLESTIFTSEKGLKVWVWCLLRANHRDQDVFIGRQKVHISSGEFIMGRNTATQELGISVGTLWFWLDRLQQDGYIERRSTNKWSVIAVRNYNKYQENERTLNADSTTDRTQIVQQIEPNKNDKNDNNDNKLATKVANINKFIDMFKTVNPSYERLFGNKTQRDAMERLVIKFTPEKMMSLLTKLPEIVQKPYAPQITTPYELETKMGKLIQFLNQEKMKEDKGGVTYL